MPPIKTGFVIVFRTLNKKGKSIKAATVKRNEMKTRGEISCNAVFIIVNVAPQIRVAVKRAVSPLKFFIAAGDNLKELSHLSPFRVNNQKTAASFHLCASLSLS